LKNRVRTLHSATALATLSSAVVWICDMSVDIDRRGEILDRAFVSGANGYRDEFGWLETCPSPVIRKA
jgi:hypothetical protein